MNNVVIADKADDDGYEASDYSTVDKKIDIKSGQDVLVVVLIYGFFLELDKKLFIGGKEEVYFDFLL